jgi:hypothetical protein
MAWGWPSHPPPWLADFPWLARRSRLGCQILAAKDLDGIRVRIPSASRNFYVVSREEGGSCGFRSSNHRALTTITGSPPIHMLDSPRTATNPSPTKEVILTSEQAQGRWGAWAQTDASLVRGGRGFQGCGGLGTERRERQRASEGGPSSLS